MKFFTLTVSFIVDQQIDSHRVGIQSAVPQRRRSSYGGAVGFGYHLLGKYQGRTLGSVKGTSHNEEIPESIINQLLAASIGIYGR